MPNLIYVIDLFAGAGGFTSGVHEAGHCVVACLDHWEKGLALHYANFPDCVHLKIRLGGEVEPFVQSLRVLIEALVPSGATYHVHASPPCQSFSIAQRQKKPTKALLDAEADPRSSLLIWALEVIRQLDPPRWSLEQVPTALPFLEKHAPWIFESDASIRIYPKVYGYEFDAPTMRKRLFMGKGWSFDGKTTPFGSKKRFRCEAEHALGLAQTRPEVAARMLTDAQELGAPASITLKELAIKTSANKWSSSKKEREAGRGPNRVVDPTNGEGLRLIDGTPSFAAIASYPLTLFRRIKATPVRHHRTYLDGTWVKLRALKPSELAALQGFGRSYRIDELTVVDLRYWDTVAAFTGSALPHRTTVRLTNADKVRGVGNSVVSSIAACMFA